MWLGGGFYGLAGLWTLFIVEVNDLLRFIGGLPEFIDTFNGGFFELFMMFLMNQFSNLIAAFALVYFLVRRRFYGMVVFGGLRRLSCRHGISQA